MSIYLVFFSIIKFVLSESLCKHGAKNCELCNPITNICIKCEYEDIYVPDKYGGCEASKKCILGKNHCIECNFEGNLCNECDRGYFPDENGACSYTNNCEISYKGICLQCKDNYILNEQINICKPLNSEEFRNCEIIKTLDGTCEKCKEGFYLTSEDKKCTKTENCKESLFDTCTKCDVGYYLNKKEEKCFPQKDDLLHCKEVINGEECYICDDNYFFDEENKCVDTNYCKRSGEFHQCENCTSGYFLSESDNSCTNTENCYSGIKSIGICEECKSGFYIDFEDGQCKSNQEENDFQYCKSSKGECNECIKGYYLGQDHKCTTEIYCAESINGTCIECKNEYYLGLDHKCSSIEHCIYSYDYTCEECEDNFYFDKHWRKCLKAENNFANCKYGSERNGCERCKDDYYLNQTNNLCYDNKVNNSFYRCAMTDVYGEYCLFCVKNYYLGNRCSKVPGCDYSESDDRCLECNLHHCLDVKTGLCEENDRIIQNKTFYFLCRRTNEEGTACDECLEGLFLHDNGTCIQNSTDINDLLF